MSVNVISQVDITTGYKPNIRKPIDWRTKISTLADTTTLTYKYKGLQTYVETLNKYYTYNGTKWLPLSSSLNQTLLLQNDSLFLSGSLDTIDLKPYIDSTGNWIGLFDGQEGSYYLDYTNATNKPNTPWVLNGSKIYYNSGNVGIGLTSPQTALMVNGSISTASGANYSYISQSGDASTYRNSYGDMVLQANGELRLQTYNSGYQERMLIDNNGNVGIGTTGPTKQLHITKEALFDGTGIGDYTPALTIQSNTNATSWARLDIRNVNVDNPFILYHNHIGDAYLRNDATGGDINFTFGANTRMSIQNSGDIGIGTTSPSELLDVNGNARFRSIGSGTSAGALHYTSTGVLTTSTSDKRLKKKIKTIDNALKKVTSLKGRYFEWKSEKGQQIGLIAQEVEKIVPELVFTNPNDGFKGVHYDKTVALLIEAIKEQQGQISDQQKQINNLEKRIKILENN